MTHEITLSINSGYIRASCSCGEFNGEAWSITLADLNGAVHEHIEASEAAVGGEGYGTKSAITSEDELVDIETGLDRRDLRNDTAWTGSTYGV